MGGELDNGEERGEGHWVFGMANAYTRVSFLPIGKTYEIKEAYIGHSRDGDH